MISRLHKRDGANASPVVATKPGGPEEIITDGQDGLLVPFGSPSQMAQAVTRFLKDPSFASNCARAAATRARAFDGTAYPQRVQAAVHEILQAKETPRPVAIGAQTRKALS